MQVDVFIIEPGLDVAIMPVGVDVSTEDGFDVTISQDRVEAPSGEVIECVSGNDGARGKPARADLAFAWSGQLRPGEQLPGIAITAPTIFDENASFGYARVAPTADAILTLCNRDPSTVIGMVSWPAGQHDATVVLNGDRYTAQRGDFLFLVAPMSADPTLADAGVTIAGDTVQ